MATESSEVEEERKLTVGNKQLVVDGKLHEMVKMDARSASSYKPINGVSFLLDTNYETYWQYVNFFLFVSLNFFSFPCVWYLCFQVDKSFINCGFRTVVHNHILLTFNSKIKLKFKYVQSYFLLIVL